MVYLGEFIGTAILILLGNGVVANVVLKGTKGNNSGWIVIATGWGIAVAMAVYAMGWLSGAHINPAVTFGLAVGGQFDWALVPGYFLAQVAGAAFGSFLVYLCYYQHWALTDDPTLKLAAHSTIPAVRGYGPNFLTEVIGTFMLVFGIFAIVIGGGQAFGEMATVDLRDAWTAGMWPLVVGFLVWGIGLSLGGPTGYAINPARDLGPRIMHQLLPIPGKGTSDWAYSWVPIVAPLLGGGLAGIVWLVFSPAL
ncbi:MIP/aquaporin family protein [Aquisalimonas sp.]|uniref:MIP/aquaporin family protein n=1 Tax=Aquisalimonas sp. TaxID=1872621 RepID=UPI0025C40C59|nr:MIP/aquaporin family protein [Aquisalimonas sp.]